MGSVAYFCMEYGLHEELPIYAGGLGILAGDYLKEAKRGTSAGGRYFGILWRRDYTKQLIGEGDGPRIIIPSTIMISSKTPASGSRSELEGWRLFAKSTWWINMTMPLCICWMRVFPTASTVG